MAYPPEDGIPPTSQNKPPIYIYIYIYIYTYILGWAGHLPDHLADLDARAPKLKNVTAVAPWAT